MTSYISLCALLAGLLATACSTGSAFQDDRVVTEVIRQEDGPVERFDERPSWNDAKNEIGIGIGPALWEELPDQRPTVPFPTSDGFGNLQAWGFNFEIAYRRRVADWDGVKLWLGAEFGVIVFEERRSFFTRLPNGEVIDDEVSADVLRLAANARLDVPLGPVVGFVGGGAGWYSLGFQEASDGFHSEEDSLDSDTALGGYVQLGLDFPISDHVSLRVEDKMHFVRFHDLSRFSPGNDSIGGPIHTLQVGVGIRF